MVATSDTLWRDAKLFVDRDDLTLEEAASKLTSKRIVLAVGRDVGGSATLQAALLTAASTAARWCGSVSLVLPRAGFSDELRLPWPDRSLTASLLRAAPGLRVVRGRTEAQGASVLRFGDAEGSDDGLQVTFDGWRGGVQAPGSPRLAERERCPLAGVLAGGLAVAEVFLRFAAVNPRAESRGVSYSLWRPDLNPMSEAAVGPVVAYLPGAYWLLGLGHLGQAYAWALSLLPYSDAGPVRIMLQDFDRVEEANLRTQVLTRRADIGTRKTRVVARFLRRTGFDPAVVDRAFDGRTVRGEDEPELALCGFDGRGPRHLLDDAGFERVVECGLGGTHRDFDDFVVHSLPHPRRHSCELWAAHGVESAMAERLAGTRRVYQDVARTRRCGHVALAERSVAVPFVGAVASSFVLAETLRMLNGGERFLSVGLQLSSPDSLSARQVQGGYGRGSRPRLSYQNAQET